MWIRPAILALFLATGSAHAQSAGDSAASLNLCFRNASLADEICAKLKDAPLQQLECWRKTQASQVACLEHVMVDPAFRPSSDSRQAAAPPVSEIQPDTQPKRETVDDLNGKDRQQSVVSRAPNAGQADAKSPDPPRASDLQNSIANASAEVSPEDVKDRRQSAANQAPNTGRRAEARSPDPPRASGLQNSVANASAEVSPEDVKDRRQSAANQAPDTGRRDEARSADLPPAAVLQYSEGNATLGVGPKPAKAHDPASAKSLWLVSETTSPIDYSPIVDAEIRPIMRAQDGPDALAVGCRAGRIEVAIRRNPAWSGSVGLEVEYQIDGRPAVRERWILSADRKVAKKGNPAEFLQSTPDGAALKIAIRSQPNAQYTSFELVGLSAIRPSVEKACGQGREKPRTSSSKQ
jgi:hypothetical protein